MQWIKFYDYLLEPGDTRSRRPIRPKRSKDDRLVFGRDGLPWRRPGWGGRSLTTDTRNCAMRKILYPNKLGNYKLKIKN